MRDKRWASGAAAIAVGVTAAQAATVQITLTGNSIGVISSSSYNTLFKDLTGDGINDISFTSEATSNNQIVSVAITIAGHAKIWEGFSAAVGNFIRAKGVTRYGFNTLESTDLYTVSFSDARINGGALTNGFVEAYAVTRSRRDMSISLTRLVFDDAGTVAPTDAVAGESNTEFLTAAVPEPGSLSLLALGAGGILAHRRRRKTA